MYKSIYVSKKILFVSNLLLVHCLTSVPKTETHKSISCEKNMCVRTCVCVCMTKCEIVQLHAFVNRKNHSTTVSRDLHNFRIPNM